MTVEIPKHPNTQLRQRTSSGSRRIAIGYLGVWVLGCLLHTGCSDEHPATYPVTGEVFHNNQPVADASVVFTTEGPLAKGATDAAGKFTLRTFTNGDGAIAGTHRVSITKNVAQPSSADNPYPMTKNMLPAKYAQPDTSGLTAEVKESGENTFRFDLAN